MLPNPATYSYSAFLAEDELARQRAIRRARAFSTGRQYVKLTERLRSFLQDTLGGTGDDSALLRLNICKTIERAVTERLVVKGFDSEDDALSAWARNLWQRNRMDARADDVHEMCIRDGEAFVLVSYDNDAKMPRFTPHPRYVSAADGLLLDNDGYGIKAFYQDDDDSQAMLFATKRWHEVRYVNGERVTRERITYYYPNKVEKYELKGGLELVPIRDEGDTAWPVPWVDANGNPLGIPVAHVKNANLDAEAWEAIPLQNAINKTLTDLLAAGDMTAFRVLVALGWKPVDGNGNPITFQPGTVIGSEKPDAKVKVVDGADLGNILGVIDSLIAKAAMVTDTPVSRFTLTRQVAAEGTQKQQDGPLLGKIRKRHALIGNGWEDALYIARTLETAFGSEALNPDALLSIQWESAEVRDADGEVSRLEAKQRLGVPQEQLWLEAGYSQEQIDKWLKDKAKAEQDAHDRAVALATGAMPQQTGAPNAPQPNTRNNQSNG